MGRKKAPGVISPSTAGFNSLQGRAEFTSRRKSSFMSVCLTNALHDPSLKSCPQNHTSKHQKREPHDVTVGETV